ncbi:hypothetical protein AURDEDRAFT_121208 [Auricularia subglabra TFB-10046 SS5]|nr:hypothetical protein AURDEDRAFT_121208 [Auricularia subglabra TFB-10046 SS5]
MSTQQPGEMILGPVLKASAENAFSAKLCTSESKAIGRPGAARKEQRLADPLFGCLHNPLGCPGNCSIPLRPPKSSPKMPRSTDAFSSSSEILRTYSAGTVKDYAEKVYERAMQSKRHKDDCEAIAYDARQSVYAIYNSYIKVGDTSEQAQYALREINIILVRLDNALTHIAKPGRWLTIRRKEDELELQKIKTNLAFLKLEIGITMTGCTSMLRGAGVA